MELQTTSTVRKTAAGYPLVGYAHDNAGRLSTRTDRKGSLVSYAYTPSGKARTITYPSGTPVTYTHTPAWENIATMTDSLGTSSYQYDAANRLISQTDPNGFSVGYAYDTAGNLITPTYPGNKTLSYTYDSVNRLQTVKINWLAGAPTATYSYDSAGRLSQLSNFNGTLTTYSYDNANRLLLLQNTTAGGAILSSQSYTLDANGNRTQETRTEPQAPLNHPVENISFSYNTQKNRLNSAGSDTFTYDNEGQQITKNTTSYSWDFEHRLTQLGTTQFAYDGVGNRLKVTRGGTTSKYLYDQSGNLLAEANNAGTITRYYIHGLGLLATASSANELHAYHFDATGHTVALTDSGQSIVNRYSYDAYGRTINQTETIPQPFKYVGQYGVMTEAEGVLYMRARYYDPSTGRFISEDPIGFDGGDVNLYAYVGGNPVMGVDPSGTFCVPCAAVGAGIGGVSGGLTAYFQGGSIGDIAASTFIGIVGGGVSGLTLGAGGALFIGAASSGVGSATGQYVTSGTVDPSEVALSVVAGTTGGAFGLLARKAGQSAVAQTVTSSLATAETQAIFNFGTALNKAYPVSGSRSGSSK